MTDSTITAIQDAVETSAAPDQLVIDKELYDKLKGMYSSEDKENRTIAINIILKCDIDKSIYYLWRILVKDGQVHYFDKKYKKIRLFLKDYRIIRILSLYTEYSLATFLKNAKLLTPEIWKDLEKEVISYVERWADNPFYDAKLTLKSSIYD